jgi:glycosyltransferase involved in cell wall biosynthesis
MINDCASVGETLLKYLPPENEKQHIKRSRGLWSKTFGVAFKILKAKGDIYHAHYLLQDCYIASHLGKKPLIGHAHGSDLRQMLKSKKWGRIVKHNLETCDKVVVAQPTILNIALEHNPTAEYFPIPFDPQIFFPIQSHEKSGDAQVFLASAHNFEVKGTNKLIEALAPLKKQITLKTLNSGKDKDLAKQLCKKLNLKAEFIEKVPHNEINKQYWESDLVLGSAGIGQLDTVAIEAMACGRPVVHSISKEYFPNCPLEEFKTGEEISQQILRLLTNKKDREERIANQLAYVNSTHSAPVLVRRLLEIYSEAQMKKR